MIIAAYWSAPFQSEAIGDRYLLDGREARRVLPTQSRALLQTGLNQEIRVLNCAGKEVYVLQDSPSFDFNPVSELEAQLIGPRRMVTRLLSRKTEIYKSGIAVPRADGATRDAAQIIAAVASSNPEVHLVNLKEPLCSTSGCRFALGSRSLYIDEQHLSPLGARLALSNLKLPRHAAQATMGCSAGD